MGNANQQRRDDRIQRNIHLVGFENKSLTLCYANSVLQVLFNHPVFIEIITKIKDNQCQLISQLSSTYQMIMKKKQKGSISTIKLMKLIQKKSKIFQRDYHQDCHQFYIWLMDSINDQLKKINKKNNQPTKLQQQFFWKRVTRTQCCKCQQYSQITQQAVDMSLTLPQPNVSVNHCIQHYSQKQQLVGQNRFKCDKCNGLRDAKKCTLIKTLPKFLSIHLARFKYDDERKRMIKLMYLIPFPLKIKLKTTYTNFNKQINGNFIQDDNKQTMYKLVGVVAHLGKGENYGHYISYIKIGKQWFLINDDQIQTKEVYQLESLWGLKGMNKCAYMLFYTQ